MPDLTAHQRALARWFTNITTSDGDDWRAQAHCARPGVDPEIFFPNSGYRAATAAKAICAVCPVRQPCLDAANTNLEQHGIWGGMTRDERREQRGQDHRLPTHCRNSHEYTPANTAMTAQGRRCRECQNRANRELRERRRAQEARA